MSFAGLTSLDKQKHKHLYKITSMHCIQRYHPLPVCIWTKKHKARTDKNCLPLLAFYIRADDVIWEDQNEDGKTTASSRSRETRHKGSKT
jgi:hypothetical protein